MSLNPLSLPVGPEAIRVFCGYRAEKLPRLSREASEEEKRKAFFNELAKTFMPGTPLMQAPLGLSAYVPAVIDPDRTTGVPDEVAIIVYVSLEQYQNARANSLSRRMYTHSHAAVFDMDQSRAMFPGPSNNAQRLDRNGVESWSWYLFENDVDWQDGATRVLLLQQKEVQNDFPKTVLETTKGSKNALAQVGCDQLIAFSSPGYAALWLHLTDRAQFSVTQLGLLPENAELLRDLWAIPKIVPGDDERGVVDSEGNAAFDGPCSFNFRFSRDLRFFV